MLVIFSFYSCVKIVDIGLDETNPRDVIQAIVSNDKLYVKLSRSAPYSSSKLSKYNIKTGVSIELNVDGTIYNSYTFKDTIHIDSTTRMLTLTDEVHYIEDVFVIDSITQGKNYTINIKIDDNNGKREYTSTQKGFAVPEFKVNRLEKKATPIENYIQAYISITSKVPNDFQSINISSDIFGEIRRSYTDDDEGLENFDIAIAEYEDDDDDDPNEGNSIIDTRLSDKAYIYISFVSIELSYYMRTLMEYDSGRPSNTKAPPSNPLSNIVNKGNKEENVLGFFGVYNFKYVNIREQVRVLIGK